MAQNTALSAARQKRVRILKRLIVISLLTSILIPIVLCIVLFAKLKHLEQQIDSLEKLVTDSLYKEENFSDTVTIDEDGSPTAGSELSAADANAEDAGAPGSSTEDAEPEESGTKPDSDTKQEDSPEATQPENMKKVYLTFDDGPSSNTDEILDILAEYDIKATFFVVGKEADWAKEAYKRIAEEGHTLGLHSYSHDYNKIYASAEDYAEDLNRLRDYLYEETGISCKFVRFPGGSSNKVSKVDMREFIDWLSDTEYVYFDWNVSSQDASKRKLSADEILNNCLDGIYKHDNAVVLMHDAAGRDTTVEALPALIEAIQAMENTELLPITEEAVPVQHIKKETED